MSSLDPSPAFAPESDLFRTSGTNTNRWRGVFTLEVSDGVTTLKINNIAPLSQMTAALAGKADKSELAGYATNSALVSGLANKADIAALNNYVLSATYQAGMTAKADLIDGMVPINQIPVQLLASTFSVPIIADLVTLTEAKANDFARITTGDDAGKIFVLTGYPATELTNWLDITTAGGVVTVNGQTGAVTITLASLPDAAAALAAKANLDSPVFTGQVRVPEPSAGDDGDAPATTHFVNTVVFSIFPSGYSANTVLGRDVDNAAAWLTGRALVDEVLPEVTTTASGTMLAADKVKLDAIADGATNTPLSDAIPEMDGVASAGVAEEAARGDHRHPTDITRASTALATQETAGLMSALDKEKLDGIPPGGGGGGGGTTDHRYLTNRDAEDQHPTSAITGLSSQLASKADTSELANYATNAALSSGLADKADVSSLENYAPLVGGVVPLENLPLDRIKIDWGVQPSVESLIDLTDANPGDTASVVIDSAIHAFILISAPPTVLANWQDISASGGNVISVNGQVGVVSISAGNLPGLPEALSTKQNTITGAASSITANNLTASRALVSDASGKVAASTATSSEVGYLSGVTAAIQTQIDGKQNTLSPATPTTAGIMSATDKEKLDSIPWGGGAFILGEIRLLPFRSTALPQGWYYPSGDYVAQSSAQGQALVSLSSTFKSDWGITVSGSNIRLCDPAKFFSGTFGRFFRPVNSSNRMPGSLESDAQQNITGSYDPTVQHAAAVPTTNPSPPKVTGVFGVSNWNSPYMFAGQHGAGSSLTIDASKQIRTATEVRPINVGMTPAIYLGV